MTVRSDLNDIRELDFAPMRQSGNAGQAGPRMTPVSPCHDWIEVNSDASIQSDVTIPGDLNMSDSDHLKLLRCGQSGTAVLVRMRYPEGAATASTIRVFGFDSSMMNSDTVVPKPELLPDVDGNLDIVLTPDVADDPQDADGNAYTLSVRIDYHGNMFLLFPSVGASGQGAIEVRVI